MIFFKKYESLCISWTNHVIVSFFDANLKKMMINDSTDAISQNRTICCCIFFRWYSVFLPEKITYK